jgi:hypothetical protein
MQEFFDFFKSLIIKIWGIEPHIYLRVTCFVVVLTFVSNHYLRWKCFVHNKKRGDVLFEVEDSVSGFKIRPHHLTPKKARAPKRAFLARRRTMLRFNK